jgi:transcriptional antiterminator NusG
MNYYAIQVKTRGEETFLNMAKNRVAIQELLPNGPDCFIWPRRKLFIRKSGKTREHFAPIFPGYVFLEIESISHELYINIQAIKGFYRFLKDNRHIIPLEARDREILLHFLSYGEIVESSEVCFDENQRIRVMKGPMKGLEGNIVKVDKRKKRAKVRIHLYEESFLIDFGFQLLEAAKRNV